MLKLIDRESECVKNGKKRRERERLSIGETVLLENKREREREGANKLISVLFFILFLA